MVLIIELMRAAFGAEMRSEWMEVSMLASEWMDREEYEKNWIVFVKSEFVQLQ